MTRNTVVRVLGIALAFALITGPGTTARTNTPVHPDRPAGGQECLEFDRQPATKALMDLVASDDDLRVSLMESIALGQKVNGDPQTNPVASIADYYDFIDALVTYDPSSPW